MRVVIIILYILLFPAFALSQEWGRLVRPPDKSLDSLIPNKTGVISVDYYINPDGKIVSYKIHEIIEFNAKRNKYESVYSSRNGKKTNRYSKKIIKKIKPWFDNYIKNSRFEKGKDFNPAVPFGVFNIEYGVEIRNKLHIE